MPILFLDSSPKTSHQNPISPIPICKISNTSITQKAIKNLKAIQAEENTDLICEALHNVIPETQLQIFKTNTTLQSIHESAVENVIPETPVKSIIPETLVQSTPETSVQSIIPETPISESYLRTQPALQNSVRRKNVDTPTTLQATITNAILSDQTPAKKSLDYKSCSID